MSNRSGSEERISLQIQRSSLRRQIQRDKEMDLFLDFILHYRGDRNKLNDATKYLITLALRLTEHIDEDERESIIEEVDTILDMIIEYRKNGNNLDDDDEKKFVEDIINQYEKKQKPTSGSEENNFGKKKNRKRRRRKSRKKRRTSNK
jgi:hypothetical protein